MPEEELSDGEVVREILGGQHEMYRVLVRRYQDVLYRHAYRMVDQPDEASDIVQKTLVSGFQKLNRCRDPERVGGWLFRIAANLCKDFLKSPRRADLSLEGASAKLALALERRKGSMPDSDLEREELKERVKQALERLSPEQREAFVLKHLEGRSYGEMATLLGASKSALKMRVLRARARRAEPRSPWRGRSLAKAHWRAEGRRAETGPTLDGERGHERDRVD